MSPTRIVFCRLNLHSRGRVKTDIYIGCMYVWFNPFSTEIKVVIYNFW